MTDDDVTQLLFVRDEPVPADLALVFGHHDPSLFTSRARHAAGLYRAGLVPRLLLSGGAVRGAVSEAREMARAARAEGVPEEALLLEAESRNTFENIARSLGLLREVGLLEGVATVLLVSCPWHMRRILLTARQAFPARTRLLCCPHPEGCTAASWANSAACRSVVLGEWRLLARFVSGGLLPTP